MPIPTPTLSLDAVAGYVRRLCEADGGGSRTGVELEWLTRPLAAPDQPTTMAAVTRVASAARPLPADGTVTFEPGGQLELSTRPFATLDAAVAAASADSGALRSAAGACGIALHATGIDPVRPPRRVLDTPRYRAMERYFDRGGEAGRRMMCSTAALQINVGAGPEASWGTRFDLAQRAGPALVAAFANSPIAHGRPTGFCSTRMAVWAAIDRSRCAPVELGDDVCASWADYALEAHVMLIRRGDEYAVVEQPLPMRDWIVHGHALGFPDEDDLAYHMTTLFPPVRLKGWLEVRMIDALPSPYWEAAATVVVSLLTLCDPVAVKAAVAGTEHLWAAAARHGMAHPDLARAAAHLFDLAGEAAPPSLSGAVRAYRQRFVDRHRSPAHDQLDARREPAWI